MAKSPTPPKKAKTSPKKNTRGLGRGLSALMSDISAPEMAEMVTGPDNVAPEAAEKKPNTGSKANTKSKAKTQTGASSTKAKPDTATPQTAPSTQITGRGVRLIPMDQLVRNPDQPRRYFDPELLRELTQSIEDKGVLQPILVRPVPARDEQGRDRPLFQIVAGERRYQASLRAKVDAMPALVRELSDQDVLEIGVVENVQRADLNPIEEAAAYRALIDQFGHTQDDIAQAIGKSRPHIANMLRLLSLPDAAQDALKQGQISMGHARAVIAAPDPAALVQHIIENKLSVREAESWAKRLKADDKAMPPVKTPKPEKTADIRKIESELTDRLGIAVVLSHKGPTGELKFKYKSDAQLERLLYKLRG